jgi:hypothetical protein
MKRQCFVCDKQLESAKYACGFGDPTDLTEMDFEDPPMDATTWTTSGNFGSTLIDCIPGARAFEISICDECLKAKANKVTWYNFDFNTKKTTDFGEGLIWP